MAIRVTHPTLCYKPNTFRVRTGRNPTFVEHVAMEAFAQRISRKVMAEADGRLQVEPTGLSHSEILALLKEVANPGIIILSGVTRAKNLATPARLQQVYG
jgi:hypothetical protein